MGQSFPPSPPFFVVVWKRGVPIGAIAQPSKPSGYEKREKKTGSSLSLSALCLNGAKWDFEGERRRKRIRGRWLMHFCPLLLLLFFLPEGKTTFIFLLPENKATLSPGRVGALAAPGQCDQIGYLFFGADICSETSKSGYTAVSHFNLPSSQARQNRAEHHSPICVGVRQQQTRDKTRLKPKSDERERTVRCSLSL